MQQSLPTWLDLELKSSDYCPTHWVSGCFVLDLLFQMSLVFYFIAPYCMHWMMAMFLTKCLNSMCYATFVFRPLNLQNLMTLLLRRLVHEVAQVCAGSLALPEDLSGPAVLSPTGTALQQATH